MTTPSPPSRFLLTRVPAAQIVVGEFAGPLELLLHQLGQGHREISTVSLGQVADRYLAAIHLLPEAAQRLDFLADFLIVAAQLLVLKSRALLPREASRPAEPETVDEGALAERLAEYRRYRAAAARLNERQAAGAHAFSRLASPPIPSKPAAAPLEPASPEQLAHALQRLLETRAPASQPDPVPRLTIRDRMAGLRMALREHGRISFNSLATQCATRADLILLFLAVLELYRAREIDLSQDALFGAIWLAQLHDDRCT